MKRLMMLVGMLVVLGCGHLTPAQRVTLDVVTCRYGHYVVSDPALTQEQKEERLELVRKLRKSLGWGKCKEVGR